MSIIKNQSTQARYPVPMLLLIILLLSACGNGYDTIRTRTGDNCYIYQRPEYVSVICSADEVYNKLDRVYDYDIVNCKDYDALYYRRFEVMDGYKYWKYFWAYAIEDNTVLETEIPYSAYMEKSCYPNLTTTIKEENES